MNGDPMGPRFFVGGRRADGDVCRANKDVEICASHTGLAGRGFDIQSLQDVMTALMRN